MTDFVDLLAKALEMKEVTFNGRPVSEILRGMAAHAGEISREATRLLRGGNITEPVVRDLQALTRKMAALPRSRNPIEGLRALIPEWKRVLPGIRWIDLREQVDEMIRFCERVVREARMP